MHAAYFLIELATYAKYITANFYNAAHEKKLNSNSPFLIIIKSKKTVKTEKNLRTDKA